MQIEKFKMRRNTAKLLDCDMKSIAKLWSYISCGITTIDPQTIADDMRGKDHFVARSEQNDIVGLASLWVVSSTLCKFELLSVDERYRHKGIGETLAETGIDHVFGKYSCEQIITFALPPSQGIFDRLGFATFEESDGVKTMTLDRPVKY